jgi:gamma-glutamylputrescine oxidase
MTAATGPSGWQRDDPATGDQPPLGGDTEADVVVVGAGLAGLALAHHLARHLPPESILVLEAGRAGGGASGRSTGICGPGVGGPVTGQVRRYGPEVTRRMFDASLRGIAALRRLAGALPGDCELTDTYQLITASTPAHAARLRRRAETLRDLLGFDVGYLSRARTAQRLGTDRYHGALRYPDVAMVNPWLLCQELKRALLGAGVRIAEGTAVTAVAGGDPATLTAGGHLVRARRVALATDGFTPSLKLFRGTVATVRTHVLRTEVVPPGLLACTGWNGRGTFIDSRNFFNYVRLTARGRLLFGGGPALLDDRASTRDVAAVRSRLGRELAAVFPVLAGVEVTDFWSGITAATFDRLPIVGPVPGEPGVWFAGAWCGHGLALSALTAEHLAPILAAPGAPATDDPPLPWQRGRSGWMPSGRLGGTLLSAYLRGLGIADRAAAARPGTRQASPAGARARGARP